jgi:hypothetical protein
MQLPSHGVANEVSIRRTGGALSLSEQGEVSTISDGTGTRIRPPSLFPSLNTEKRAACKCKRPKSREETPKEGSDSLVTAALYV